MKQEDNPNKRKIQPGDVFDTYEGEQVVVLEYRNALDVLVKHLDEHGHIRSVRAYHLKEGRVKNPYKRTASGVGYIGHGKYKPSKGRVYSKAYKVWTDMLHRVYSEKALGKDKSYVGCSVCEEWHNFQNFAEWYYQQPNAESSGFHLDKDLIKWGNKVYCPEACSLVPEAVNSILTGSPSCKKDLPRGVYKKGNKYGAGISVKKKREHLGTYDTIEEARSVYEEAKRDHIKRVVDEHKDVLDPRVYENLINWKLEYLED